VLELRGAFQKPPKTGQGQIGAGLRVLKLATEAPLSGKVGSMTRAVIYVLALMLLTTAAVAHHGWGSYDANKPLTISGPILSSKFENPHATITVRASDKVWTVTLAPTSRMSTRGATEKVVAVGQDVSAYGYPSTVEKDEMRAERITVNGKTYEMR